MDINGDTSDIQAFYEWLQSWGASQRTIGERTTAIRALLRDLGPVETVTTDRLTTWLANPRYAQWTRVTYFSHLRSYFGWMVESGRLPMDPTVGLRAPKTPKDKPRPLSATQARRALEHANTNQYAWLKLGLLAGLRAHEIAKIRGEDVEQDAIYVLGKGRQMAFIPTHPELWGLAANYPQRGFWFPARGAAGHVSPHTISTQTTRLFKSLEIDGSIHRCRHSFATNLLRGGTNMRVVQTLMRHGNLATTARYAAVDEDERATAVRTLAA